MNGEMRLLYHPESGWRVEGDGIPSSLSDLGKGEPFWGRAFLWLAGVESEQCGGDAGLLWLRRWVSSCVEKLAIRRSVSEKPFWTDEEMEAWGKECPALRGSEYVGAELMILSGQALWRTIQLEVARYGGEIDLWLESLGEHWRLIGKVIFHLSELPGTPERPFGFLATYAGKVSSEGKPQHVPLARLIQRCRAEGEEMDFFLSPLRRAAQSSAWLREWMESGRLLQAQSLSVDEACSFIREVPALRKAGLLTRMPAQWEHKLPSRVVVQVELSQRPQRAVPGRPLWEFDSCLALDGKALSPEELARIRESEGGLVSLRGKWVDVDLKKVDSLLSGWHKLKFMHAQGIPLSGAMRLLAGMGSPLPIIRETGAGMSGEEGCADWSIVKAGEELAACLQSFRERGEVPTDDQIKADLRPYQQEGVAWMWSLYRWGLGACLADDMGLGKTLQVLAFLSLTRQSSGLSDKKPSLIVVPSSLLANWDEEMRRFVPHLCRRIYHGESATGIVPENGVDVILTTYSLIHRRDELQEYLWDVVVFDEAQNVKNASSLQAAAAAQLKAEMKIALSGTPIENGLGDLWSLMNIINPGLLGQSFSSFVREWDSCGEAEKYGKLRRLIAPVLLRRMKSDASIALHLPPKTEVVQRCRFTRRQAQLYERLTEELRRQLFSERISKEAEQEENSGGRSALVLKYMMKFKQLCDHPSLLNGDNIFAPEEGGKFHRLKELAAEWVLHQQKVLVFTQFREMCLPLARFLSDLYGREGLVMHGGISLEQRRRDVARFQENGGPPFYVLSVKTAGTGLTLTQASHVVHFDRWWNPSVENQASDRAYRLGQTKPVLIHKFMVPGTLEEKIDRLIHSKKELAADVLNFDESLEKDLCRMSNDELFSFITGK